MFFSCRDWMLSCLVLGSLGLAGCHKTPEQPATEQTSSASTASHPVAQRPAHIREFAATANDAHDIQQLENFTRNFHDMSQEMRTELEQLKKNHQLSQEFVMQRKHDQVHSALNMLKELDLKTEQGRYIQGMMSAYWDSQREPQKQTPADQSTLIQAAQQLEYWKAHTESATAP